MLVRHHLHLDVVGAADQPFEEHRAVAEGLGALGPRALEGGRQVLRRVHHADAPATAPRCGLDHQREADRRRRAATASAAESTGPPLQGARGTPACSASRLAPILSPRRRITSALGADEDDAEAVAQLDELRPLGHEPPAHPGRLGAAAQQRPLQRGEVEVRQRLGAVQHHDLVGLPGEAGPPLGLGGHGDGAQRRRRPLEVQLPDGVDGPHRGLAPVDDGHSAEVPAHALPPPATSPVERWSTGADRRSARRRMLRPSPVRRPTRLSDEGAAGVDGPLAVA